MDRRKSSKGDLHLQERILKQCPSKKLNPYTKKKYTRLTVSLCRDSKEKGVVPGRLVYYCFVKKFDLDDQTVVIAPKDGDHFNNRHTNLRLIKKSEVQIKTYKDRLKRRPVKSVSQYDYKGDLKKTYPSIREAAAETGYSVQAISQAANGHLDHCFGWIWKFGANQKIKPVKFPYRHVRPVAQFTAVGELVRNYFSITEAEKITGYDDMGIRDAALGKRKLYKGYAWKYLS